MFLATRPNEMLRLSRPGAVRRSRTEALNIIKQKKPFNFFAFVEVNKHTYVDDTVEVTTLKFDLECGNHHYASYMDYTRCMEEFTLEITYRAKAAIIESILGLGYIFTNKGFEDLRDMPDIVNDMENGLISFQPANFKHKMRGPHPVTVESWEDSEIMGDTEPCMEDWPRT
eukprot:6364624-Heterocapsa_arctica.AAC.1